MAVVKKGSCVAETYEVSRYARDKAGHATQGEQTDSSYPIDPVAINEQGYSIQEDLSGTVTVTPVYENSFFYLASR